mgnify:CR=1 FL=1
MPLLKGKSNIGKNIKTEMSHGKSHDQAVAIAMNVAGKSGMKNKSQADKMRMMGNDEMEELMKSKKK